MPADTPPPFVFWVSTAQPPSNCLLFPCLQAPFSEMKGRERKREKEERGKEKRLRGARWKTQRNPPGLVGQHGFFRYSKRPVAVPEMLSVTLDVTWEIACPRTAKKHRAFSISIYSSEGAMTLLDAAWKESFCLPVSVFLPKAVCLGHPAPCKPAPRMENALCLLLSHPHSPSLHFFFSPPLPSQAYFSFHSPQHITRWKWKLTSFVSSGTKNLTHRFPCTRVAVLGISVPTHLYFKVIL